MFDQATKGNIIAKFVGLNINPFCPPLGTSRPKLGMFCLCAQRCQMKTPGILADVTSIYFEGEEEQITSA